MSTTTRRPATEIAAYLGGFTAAEGCFQSRPADGWFGFKVELAAADAEMVELFHEFLGCGFTAWHRRRRPHFDHEVRFVVRRLRDLVEIVVPFSDEHLPPSYKREQYLVWRRELLEYWQDRARRRRPCTVDGCDTPQRAKGLCRRHYYQAFRR